MGAGSWQAGLVASFARTDLHYRAEVDLSERGYLTGEHDTGILSLHPFAAWHASSGGHFWASLGAGMGELRHRDDLGFPSWSRSDVRLLAYDVGASVPVADVLSGELQAEAGIESFALEIEGGGNISSSLPTMRGLDYRAGVTWSAPVPGEPSVSMAYKHLTGDGPEGGALEARGSLSVPEVFDPRISVTGSAEASFGLGEPRPESMGPRRRFSFRSRWSPSRFRAGSRYSSHVPRQRAVFRREYSRRSRVRHVGRTPIRNHAALCGLDSLSGPELRPANPGARNSRYAEPENQGGIVRSSKRSISRAPPIFPPPLVNLEPFSRCPRDPARSPCRRRVQGFQCRSRPAGERGRPHL